MRKLKKQKWHSIYIMIFTITVCALMWTDIEWSKVVGMAIIPTILIAALFDIRYKSLFE